MFILDCDIASIFSKIGRIDLLKETFPSGVYITNSVYIELMRAKEMGFSFSDEIFDSITTITLNDSELIDFQKYSLVKRIHSGEAEGISICKNRNAVFLANNSIVVKFCDAKGIKVLNLKDVLIFMAENGIIPKNEMVNVLRDIEDKDNTVIKSQEDIGCIHTHDKLIIGVIYVTLVILKQKRSVFDLQHKEVVAGTLKQALIFEQKMDQAGKKDMPV